MRVLYRTTHAARRTMEKATESVGQTVLAAFPVYNSKKFRPKFPKR